MTQTSDPVTSAVDAAAGAVTETANKMSTAVSNTLKGEWSDDDVIMLAVGALAVLIIYFHLKDKSTAQRAIPTTAQPVQQPTPIRRPQPMNQPEALVKVRT